MYARVWKSIKSVKIRSALTSGQCAKLSTYCTGKDKMIKKEWKTERWVGMILRLFPPSNEISRSSPLNSSDGMGSSIMRIFTLSTKLCDRRHTYKIATTNLQSKNNSWLYRYILIRLPRLQRLRLSAAWWRPRLTPTPTQVSGAGLRRSRTKPFLSTCCKLRWNSPTNRLKASRLGSWGHMLASRPTN